MIVGIDRSERGRPLYGAWNWGRHDLVEESCVSRGIVITRSKNRPTRAA